MKPPAGPVWYPGRLWSLWDMLKIEGHALFAALHSLSKLDAIASNDADWVYKKSDSVAFMKEQLRSLIGQLKILETRLATKKAEQMLAHLGLANDYDAKATASQMSSSLDELRERIEQELEDRAIYYVAPPSAALLRQGIKSYDQSILDKFPNASTDLAEAISCLALSRNTACVFHLMRAMELAVHAAGRKLDVTVIDKDNKDLTWGKIIANMKAPIEAMAEGDERDDWSEILSLLYHVKQCWRNSTMHPKQTYTDEEAEAVMLATQTFLSRLAAVV